MHGAALIVLSLAMLIAGYMFYRSTSSGDSDTAYSSTLIWLVYESTVPSTPEEEFITKTHITSLKNTLLKELQEGDYIKKISEEQEKHIEKLVSRFCYDHAKKIIQNNNQDTVKLTKAWLDDEGISKNDEDRLMSIYIDQDKSAELLKLISDYLGVTKA